MDLECECGGLVVFEVVERKKGFIFSEAICPECGQVWRAWIVKTAKKVKE